MVTPLHIPLAGDSEWAYRLVLLRHGESTWNRDNRYIGWRDVPLTTKGEAEATQAGIALKYVIAFSPMHCTDAWLPIVTRTPPIPIQARGRAARPRVLLLLEAVRAHPRTGHAQSSHDDGLQCTFPTIVPPPYTHSAVKTAWLAMAAMNMEHLPETRAWQLNERMYGLAGLTPEEAYAKCVLCGWAGGMDAYTWVGVSRSLNPDFSLRPWNAGTARPECGRGPSH